MNLTPADVVAGFTLLIAGNAILVLVVAWLLSAVYRIDGRVDEMRETEYPVFE